MLEALIPVKEQRTYTQGRYPVQLDIPEGSTLTSGEVDRILRLASWQVPPTRDNVDGYEGGRAILLRREIASWRRGIQLEGLQVSGIGYQDIDIAGVIGLYDYTRPFHPPSCDNFMDRVGNFMRTTHAENGCFVHTRPLYRALGTYLSDELVFKVRKTHEASDFILDHLITPTVEAYGRYLNTELSYQSQPFGFIVLPLPSLQEERSSGEVQDHLIHSVVGLREPRAIIKRWVDTYIPLIEPAIKGLKELHDVARRAHLQAHLSNFYLLERKIFLCDWPTMMTLGEHRKNNLLHRTIDLVKPLDNGAQLLAAYLTREPAKQKVLQQQLLMSFREPGMDIYAGLPAGSVTYQDLFLPLIREGFPSTLDDTSIIAGWMSKQGFEGYTERARAGSPFSEHVRDLWQIPTHPLISPSSSLVEDALLSCGEPYRREIPKVGRNDLCQCGSGKKFKKCCGS